MCLFLQVPRKFGNLANFRRLRKFVACTIPAKFRSLHCYSLQHNSFPPAQFIFFVFYDIYIYIKKIFCFIYIYQIIIQKKIYLKIYFQNNNNNNNNNNILQPISHPTKFRTLRNFAVRRLRKIFTAPSIFAAPFCFDHKIFIQTPFWVILVPLEILESVESKYIQK